MAKINWQITHQLLSLIFWFLFAGFAVFSIAEMADPGLVRAYVNPNFILLPLLLVAVITAAIEPDRHEA